MENPPEGAMMEEREELMAAAGAGGEPVFRRAHFLTATNKSCHFDAFPLSSNTTTATPPKVDYQGWKGPPEEWKRWVRRLEPLYGEIWKSVGIYGAILASTYNVVQCSGGKNLILKLAEKWCPKTNTFLFPWGECTVTLEDMMILGGFPVLGELVIRPCRSDEMLRLEKKLDEEQLRIRRSPEAWLNHFMGGGREKLEHEAFLVLWLARFVFPNAYSLIEKGLFLIAINLSRGIRLALGPAVLASIYRDLGFLKKASLMSLSEYEKLVLCSPLGIVKVWAWERFPRLWLCPEPKLLQPGEPRLARWSGLSSNVWYAFDVSQVLNSSGQDFQWRPYVGILSNWDSQKLYNESDGYVMAGSGMDCEAIQVLVRCWRYSELVGMDCMEPYLPHRVGMQFGFDQDLPGLVERLNLNDENPDKAWLHYNRPVKDTWIYLPARLSTSNVTKRYRDIWARADVMGDQNPNPASGYLEMGVPDEIREQNAYEMEELLPNIQGQMDEIMEICEEDPLFPPGFGPDAVYSGDEVAKGLMMQPLEVDGNGSLELDFESGPSETRSLFLDDTSSAGEREGSRMLSLFHDQHQQRRNNSSNSISNAGSSSRLFTAEEVAFIITDVVEFLGRG